jgi:hypothetical protein
VSSPIVCVSELLMSFFRPTPIVSGEEGEILRKRAWDEAVEALKKDFPGTTEAVAALEI